MYTSCSLQGLGTDEQALIEILMTRTNQQIKEMKSVYGEGIIIIIYPPFRVHARRLPYITFLRSQAHDQDFNIAQPIRWLEFEIE